MRGGACRAGGVYYIRIQCGSGCWPARPHSPAPAAHCSCTLPGPCWPQPSARPVHAPTLHDTNSTSLPATPPCPLLPALQDLAQRVHDRLYGTEAEYVEEKLSRTYDVVRGAGGRAGGRVGGRGGGRGGCLPAAAPPPLLTAPLLSRSLPAHALCPLASIPLCCQRCNPRWGAP